MFKMCVECVWYKVWYRWKNLCFWIFRLRGLWTSHKAVKRIELAYNCDVTPTWFDKNRRSSIERSETNNKNSTKKKKLSRSLHSSALSGDVRYKDQDTLETNVMRELWNEHAQITMFVTWVITFWRFAWVIYIPCRKYSIRFRFFKRQLTLELQTNWHLLGCSFLPSNGFRTES